jgi:hypothetical protein
MTDETAIEKEIKTVWESFSNEQPIEANRIDIKSELEQVERDASTDAREHLSLWLALLDEALHCLLTLHAFAEELSAEKSMSALSFWSLVARICALTVAIRRLIVAGLEDVARILARSLLETLDLALVSLADEEFAERYYSALEDEGYDANEFWKKNIGYGALNDRVKRTLDSANMTNEQVEFFFGYRQERRAQFSSSVHSSAHSALFSGGIPSLSRPGMISLSILGHVSIHSPSLLSFVIMEIHRFGVVIFHLVASDNPPVALKSAKYSSSYPSLLTAFLTLQEMTQRYSEMLPPPFNFPDTEDDE